MKIRLKTIEHSVLRGIVLLLLFGGPLCSSALWAAESATTPGYLIAALGTGQNAQSLFFDYSSTDGRISDEIEWRSHSRAPNDFDDHRDNRGIVYVKALPPGTYRFYRIAENDGAFIHVWKFSIPFTIAAGHVTYAGDFAFVSITGRNFLGSPVPDGGYFNFSDESIRDIPIAALKARLPALTDMPVDLTTIDRSTLDAPPFCMPSGFDVVSPQGSTAPRCAAP